ncbi:MAG TPA: hypothetical protein VEC35_07840 [Noviherbaspirillum sp.]|nr:hypothetical protein [Noviherbaspirillum sp.]
MNVRRLVMTLWLVSATCAFTYWWFNSLLAIPLSETLWTWFNSRLQGVQPGIASDLEFVAVAGVGFLFAYAIAKAVAFFMKRSER